MTDVTRAEFDMLRQVVSDNARRLESIDTSGTRGVGVLQQQITDLAKDVSAVAVRQEKHDREHASDAKARASSRRWMIGTGIAFLAMIEGPLIYLISMHH